MYIVLIDERGGGMNELQALQKINIEGLCPGYKADMQRFMVFSGGSFSAESVQAFFDDMNARGLKPATIQRHRSAIKKALLQNMGTGASLQQLAMVDQFFKRVKVPRPDVKKRKEDMLNPRELKRIVEKAGPKTELILRALYQTAARISELCNIRLDDCEVKGAGVVVRIAKGKGGKERFVFMRPDTFAGICAAYAGKTFLFEVNGRAISQHTVYTLVKSAARKIGRPDGHPHSLRHSWASLNVEGLGLASTSCYLGHADTSTTARYYLHGAPELDRVINNSII